MASSTFYGGGAGFYTRVRKEGAGAVLEGNNQHKVLEELRSFIFLSLCSTMWEDLLEPAGVLTGKLPLISEPGAQERLKNK